MTNKNKKDDIKALSESFLKDCEVIKEKKIVTLEVEKGLKKYLITGYDIDIIEVEDINKHKLKHLIKLYKDKSLELESFQKYGLDLSTIEPRDFDSVEDFYNEFDDACLQQLHNYDEIMDKIDRPLRNMEEYYGSWEKLNKDCSEETEADDWYNDKHNN